MLERIIHIKQKERSKKSIVTPLLVVAGALSTQVKSVQRHPVTSR